ncbi:MAG: hypothetical protein LUG19_09320 [Desulfovibrio sp.]|uniref:hypothetical protein n=1 Tax=Desulfovibrio sp. TaxID=885 RepID=UPI0025887F6D|nr:hypothetical protein [Desulfovibrio sp.]MCD7984436.1 hypothetical protein [Desulfovibrio sp.]
MAVPAAARRGGKRLRRAVRGGQGRQQGRFGLGLAQRGVDQGFGGGPLIQPGGQGGAGLSRMAITDARSPASRMLLAASRRSCYIV